MVYIFLTRNDIYFLSIFLSRSSHQSQVRRLKEEPTMGGKGCRKQTSNDSGLFWNRSCIFSFIQDKFADLLKSIKLWVTFRIQVFKVCRPWCVKNLILDKYSTGTMSLFMSNTFWAVRYLHMRMRWSLELLVFQSQSDV